MGSENLSDVLTPRDLSSWRVSIPNLATSQDSSGKPCFVYVIEITRGLETSSEESEQQQQQQPLLVIHRQFHEFYILESKLTEFHGEFSSDAQLPSRPGKLLFGAGAVSVGSGGGGHGLDVMQDKRAAFERYLRALLAKPALKGSDMLFTFLTSSDEFSTSSSVSSGLGLGRVIRSVPAKLSSKDRGQGLVPFISTFVAQTQPGPPKPR